MIYAIPYAAPPNPPTESTSLAVKLDHRDADQRQMSRRALARQASDVTLLRSAFGALESRVERDKAAPGTRMEHAWNALVMRVERGRSVLGMRVVCAWSAHFARLRCA